MILGEIKPLKSLAGAIPTHDDFGSQQGDNAIRLFNRGS
jgi:hypothetical protein